MAKVVKFCAVCEEGFAEKFGFCPNCGGALAAYEMNPVAEKTNVGAPGNVEAKASAPILNESPAVAEKTAEPVIETFSTNGDETEFSGDESFPEAEASEISDPVPVRSSFNQDFGRSAYRQNANGASNGSQKTVTTTQTNYDDGAYHITFVEEKNASGRNMLLLGSLLLVTTMALGGVVYSLFERNLSIGSLGDDVSMLAYIGPVEPEPLIEEEPPKKNKDDGGGGGGGGKENPEPATKGRLPNQVDKPVMPPQPLPQLTNPTLANPNETQGKIKRDKTDEPVGVPTGSLASRLSSGGGSGGGIGSGRGSGVGGGIGTGEGNGIGSGSGNGNGNGNGDGNGDGDGGAPPAVKKPVVAVTEPFRIISRPRPPYTDAARQNQVTGVVRVRVTFLASGQVGSVSAVNGLPYGLTEQAIAAAKGIKFEPAKRNGVPVPTTKVIEYNFSIY